jgi:hypothetical protein
LRIASLEAKKRKLLVAGYSLLVRNLNSEVWDLDPEYFFLCVPRGLCERIFSGFVF